MTLDELITDIEDRYPSATAFTDAQKIRWINEVIYKLYRHMAVDDYSDVSTTADLAIYDFPTGVIPENITSMTISLSTESADELYKQRHLSPLGLNDPLKYNGWTKADEDTFAIYPTPTSDGQIIRIYYQVQPPEYTASDLAEDLTDYLRRDYLQAITFGVIRILAINLDDIAVANNYTLMFNNETRRLKMEEYNKNGKYPRTNDVMKPNSRQTRFNRINKKYTYYVGE